MNKDNKSYCPLAFNEIFSHNSGNYSICCWANQDDEQFLKHKTKEQSPFEFFNSDTMKNVREKMLKGEKIKACQNCYDEEKNIGYSIRTYQIEKNKNNLPLKVDKVNLKLRVFGNYCNLSCVMCHPYNSSSRKIELEKSNTKQYFSKSQFYGGNTFTQWSNVKKDILKNINSVNSIHLTGGEPLQSPQHWEFLMKEISNENAKNIDLYYDTNLSELHYKNNSVFDLITKYKNVKFGVSCDQYGDKLHFARYPINVDKFENNLMTVNKNILSLNCTVYLLNIFDLKDIKKYYFDNFKLKMSFPSYVRGPVMLSIKNLPIKIKSNLINEYKNFTKDSYFLSELHKTGSAKDFINGFNYLNSLGQYRNINWMKLWPEIVDSLSLTMSS
jgi:MoaA/NifB/PqqE/SkfB family radical SAM enzyme